MKQLLSSSRTSIRREKRGNGVDWKSIVVAAFWILLFGLLWIASLLRSSVRDHSQHIHDPGLKSSRKPVNNNKNHPLRFDWTDLEPLSPIAKNMLWHQNNCSLPSGNYMWRKKIFGLGSDIHVWGAALCNAMQEGVRIRTYHHENAWVWLDQEACGEESPQDRSTLACYFPHAELQCQEDQQVHDMLASLPNISNPIHVKCDNIMQHHNISDWRAAGAEMLFTHVSPLVQEEAERQLQLVFPDKIPPDLITVHIRWGDKKYENRLHSVNAYIKAIEEIKTNRGDSSSSPTNIFLSTEDPEAVKAFQKEIPADWNVFLDQFYHEMLPFRPVEDIYNKVPHTSRKLKGKVGLWSLGSLLVAMEANAFVLTRTSNWSRLMDELRKNVLHPRCNHCTHMVDVSRNDPKFKEW